MVQEKISAWVRENMAALFGWSISRVGDRHDAEDLAHDIICEILRTGHRVTDERCMNAYFWRIAQNVFVDRIRRKYTDVREADGLSDEPADESESPEEAVIRSEELRLLRRELSLLSEMHRRAAVYYYIDHHSCPEISEKLGISTEMVKYYLFRARKIIREGMNMDRIYGEKSYNPHEFRIDFWGTKAGSSTEYNRFTERKLCGNILLAAYYSRITAQELALELGVAMPYLEDELRILTGLGYITEVGGKYLTNIPIFTAECTAEIKRQMGEAAESAMQAYVDAKTDFAAAFGDKFADENLLRWQELLLCCSEALNRCDGLIEKNYGALPSDGLYRRIMGGDGIIWGRSGEENHNGIMGIYNSYQPCRDADGFVIAVNFAETLNAQHFQGDMAKALIACADGEFRDGMPDWMEREGWIVGGRVNYPVYTPEEFRRAQSLVKPRADVLCELIRKTCTIAAKVTADFAPEHIRAEAEYAGARIYCFDSLDGIAAALSKSWLKPVDDTPKPAVCVVKL